ncbi:hypothetical protein N7532_005406 [Penicillium argentinense]|uniref:SnoaL-like domain-containing protein n=1 Tax=Penicillium argentinense TaxID=1131581 RepID=A0A9W9FDV8_9EURO|nr:uncharacterized protein N7532_005406 [Penicillium argentinense]KAJ5098405.1 hypothetical protein N7532_005406 [Penicillium argentinense]
MQLTSCLTGSEWASNGPQTPAQRFYQAFTHAIESSALSSYDNHKFFSDRATFHNQNGVDYQGGEIWPWITLVFDQFERLEFDLLSIWEFRNDDGSIHFIAQAMQRIWAPGNDGTSPTVDVSLCVISRIGPSTSNEAPEGLQFQEAWFSWDTYKLLPYFPGVLCLLAQPKSSFRKNHARMAHAIG